MHRCRSYANSCAHVAGGRCVKLVCLKTFARWSVVLACCLVAVGPARAESALRQALQATTSDAARRDAAAAVPLDTIHPRYRKSVHRVMTDSSLFRRMPTKVVDCDPELFTFVAQNPEVLVEMWQKMGISRVSLERTGSHTFDLTDNAGTTGTLVIVEQKCDDRAQNRIVMYCEGAYEGKPFNKPVHAQCVLVLRSGSMKETNNRDYVACRLDTFVRIQRTSIELFAKAMHPWVGKTADANFTDTVSFISNFSQAAEKQPATIERLVNSLPNVTKDRQQRLVEIAYDCSEKYAGTPAARVARKSNSR